LPGEGFLSILRAVSIQLTILGSGSNGNCAYLEANGTRLLIDAGLSARQIRQRLLGIGKTPEQLNGILVTHEHSDHTQALGILSGKLRIPVYCNRLTKEAVAAGFEAQLDFRVFETGNCFEVGDLMVETFTIPHDAADPVGYMVHAGARKFGFLTDLGHATKLVVERVRQANVLLLETNHDLKLLQEDLRRPWSVKQRIASRHGHLSNDAAADLTQEILSESLQQLYLGHLSSDCNRPELALGAIQSRLDRLGARHVGIQVTSQQLACPTLVMEPSP
jgi:phosphoribosyl 1,2-cyclic phosphodiesterase